MSRSPVVLITGGAGGLGLATARRFAATGARTIIADLASSKPATDPGPLGRFACLDVTDEAAWKRIEQEITETEGRLDVLVNCVSDASWTPISSVRFWGVRQPCG